MFPLKFFGARLKITSLCETSIIANNHKREILRNFSHRDLNRLESEHLTKKHVYQNVVEKGAKLH